MSPGKERSRKNGICKATADQPGVRRVQAAELRHDEEQGEHARAVGTEEVLPLVPQAHAAQRAPLIAL